MILYFVYNSNIIGTQLKKKPIYHTTLNPYIKCKIHIKVHTYLYITTFIMYL